MSLFQPKEEPKVTPIPSAQPVRRTYHDAALKSAQHVIDLQDALDAAHQELRQAQGEAIALNRMCEEYRKDISELTAQRDWHKQCHVEIDNTLHNVASQMVNLIDRLHGKQDDRNPKDDKRIDQAIKGVEEAITGTPPQGAVMG